MNPVEKMRAEWFWTDKWTGSSGFLLPMHARGLYREMMTQAWARAAESEGAITFPCLPNDHEAIRRACACTEREWKKAWPLVSRYWRADGANLVNDTQLAVYAEALARAMEASDRGRNAAERRWSKAALDAAAHAGAHARARSRASAGAMPPHMLGECPPSPSPLTTPIKPPLRGRRRQRPGPDLPEPPEAPAVETAPGQNGCRSLVLELRERGKPPNGTWQRILDQLAPNMNPHSFATWLRPTEELGVLTDVEGERLVVVCPTDQFRSWITRNYRARIDEACQAAGVAAGLTFVTRDEVEAAR